MSHTIPINLIFTPCCGGTVLEFNSIGSTWWNGIEGSVYLYTPDPDAGGGICYAVTSVQVGTGGESPNLPPPPSQMTYIAENCNLAAATNDLCDCGGYILLTPCCEGGTALAFALSDEPIDSTVAYVYQEICYTITVVDEAHPGPLDPMPPLSEFVNLGEDCDSAGCPECCKCIRVRNIAASLAVSNVLATDCNGVLVSITVPIGTAWSEKYCLQSWTIDEHKHEIYVEDDCSQNPDDSWSCPPTTCFLLTDCEGVEDPIYATYPSISPYVNQANIVVLDGIPDVCWSFEEVSDCDCIVDVTVVESYIDCDTCKSCKGFKLTNCDDPTYVKYTLNDLSEYVGLTVEFEDCPGCWCVECMHIEPPTSQDLTPLYSFKDCEICLSKLWKLTPCEGQVADIIYTYTDLSIYVSFTLNLEGIDGICYTMEEVRDLEGNTAEQVIVNEYYTNCQTCIAGQNDCVCSSAVNGWDTDTSIGYLDCNGVVQSTAILAPGTRSPKVCLIAWTDHSAKASDILYYGDCTETESADVIDNDGNISELTTWDCPPLPANLGSVRPGYNTLNCPSDYYEKVSCNFSEIMYKDVLTERYGITVNCTKEELLKWEIKMEMLKLSAITNPDFDCPCTSVCVNPCDTTNGFIDCESGPCQSYLVTLPPDVEGNIEHTDCTTEQVISNTYPISPVAIVYGICVLPGTPIITNGTIQNLGDCTQAPVPPEICLISGIAAGIGIACDPLTGTYSQQVIVTYTTSVTTGTLDVNGQSFAITGSPQTVMLTGLLPNGIPVDVTGSFSDVPGCTFTALTLFDPPASCCQIDGIVAGAQKPCDPLTNTYAQYVTVTYSSAPPGASLIINGQSFLITGSPQTVLLTNLPADGLAVTATVSFTNVIAICSLEIPDLWIAPDPCVPALCREYNVKTILTKGGEITYDDCEGISQTIVWYSGESMTFPFCALEGTVVVTTIGVGEPYSITDLGPCSNDCFEVLYKITMPAGSGAYTVYDCSGGSYTVAGSALSVIIDYVCGSSLTPPDVGALGGSWINVGCSSCGC